MVRAAPAMTMRASTRLVLVPVTVTDRHGASIADLTKEDFSVFDNGQQQAITSLHSEDSPLCIDVVFDLSGSMAVQLDTGRRFLHAFLKFAEPADTFLLDTVSSAPGRQQLSVYQVRSMEDLLQRQNGWGRTALIDTVHVCAARAAPASRQRRVMLLISDGADNHSRCSRTELTRFLVERDVQIYCAAVPVPVRIGAKSGELGEVQQGLNFLEDLAFETGGINVSLSAYSNPVPEAAAISRARSREWWNQV